MNSSFTKNTFLLFIFCWLSHWSFGQNWHALGLDPSGQISTGSATDMSLAIDAGGTPYVAYTDRVNGNKATVKKFTGAIWVDVGVPGFSAREAYYTSLVLDPSGSPYVAYRDEAYNYQASVMKYNGSSWEYVGFPGFSGVGAFQLQLSLDPSGNPGLGFMSLGSRPTYMKYNGSSWAFVGQPDFNSESIRFPSFDLDASGTPYAAFVDELRSYRITVKKFNGSSWEVVGVPGFSSTYSAYTNLALDASNTPLVAYSDGELGKKVTVKKFNGSSWENVGLPGFSAGQADYIRLALDAMGTPYVAYKDLANGYKATVMKFNGSSWVPVGSAGFSAGVVMDFSLTFDPSGAPMVAYRDEANGGKATVMKFAIQAPVSIASQPVAATITGGQEATFRVSAAGTGPFFYQWQVSPNGGASFTNLSNSLEYNGVTTSTLTVRQVPISRNGYQYRVVVSNGTALISQAVPLTVLTLPFDNTRTWEVVGAGISAGQAQHVSLALDAHNMPVIAYRDLALGYKTAARKLAGTSWEEPGATPISPDETNYTALAMGADGTPFVVYQDGINGRRATVKKFTGGSWVNVGSGVVSAGEAHYTTIKLDAAGRPYVAYWDWANGFRATVKKFDGSSWVDVGNPGFSAGEAYYLSLAFDKYGTPFVAYSDKVNGYRATVQKFNGSSWVGVGTVGFSAGQAQYVSLAVDGHGTPYVAYEDLGNGEKATVKKFTGTAWVTVGSAGISSDRAYHTSLALDASGTPFVAYQDVDLAYQNAGKGWQATVRKFDGANWVTVGLPRFSAHDASYTSLALDASGTPYVAFRDAANNWKVSLMRFGDGVPVTPSGPTLTTGTITSTDNCAGTTLSVPFAFTGTFDATNIFTAQLSDAAGSFAAPIAIGSGVTSPITARLPAGTVAGTGYRIRILASQPQVTAAGNGVQVVIKSPPGQPDPMVGATTICPGQTNITYAVAAVAGATGYQWTLPGDWKMVAGQGTASITVAAASSGQIAVVAINDCGQSVTRTLAVTVTPAVTGNMVSSNQAICSGIPPEMLVGTLPTAGSASLAYVWESSTAGPAEGFAPAPGLNRDKDYTPTANLSVTTWFRRGVLVGNCLQPDFSNSVKITVLARPAAPVVAGLSQCGPGVVTLSATGAGENGSYRWYTDAAGSLAVANATGATFTTPVLSTTTTYYVSAVSQESCESERTAVTASILPLPQVNAGDPVAVCVNAAGFLLSGFSPQGGRWSGTGVNEAGRFDPSLAGVGSHILTYSITRDGCMATATRTVVVHPVPANPGAIAGKNSLCSGQSNLLYSVKAVSGAQSYTWTLPAGFLLVSGQGTASITVHAGSADGIISVVANGTCGSSPASLLQVSVIASPQVRAGADLETCTAAPPMTLSDFSPANGVWSGPGVTSAGIFLPDLAGVGTHTLTYQVTTQEGCSATDTRTVTVRAAPTVTLAAFDQTICSGNTSLPLNGGQPAGGTWSGPGVSNGIFNATIAGIGTHAISYTYADATGCAASASRQITVTSCTSIQDDELASDWTVYPNPSSGKIRVESFLKVKTGLVFRVISANGSLVMEKYVPPVVGEYLQVFDLQGQARGLYLLQQITDTGMVSKQFILQ